MRGTAIHSVYRSHVALIPLNRTGIIHVRERNPRTGFLRLRPCLSLFNCVCTSGDRRRVITRRPRRVQPRSIHARRVRINLVYAPCRVTHIRVCVNHTRIARASYALIVYAYASIIHALRVHRTRRVVHYASSGSSPTRHDPSRRSSSSAHSTTVTQSTSRRGSSSAHSTTVTQYAELIEYSLDDRHSVRRTSGLSDHSLHSSSGHSTTVVEQQVGVCRRPDRR